MSKELQLESFVCQNPACPVQHHAQQGTIKLRRRYGPHRRRLLKCTVCGAEFSELKGTPYWNARCSQDTVDAVVEHVTHGNSFVTTGQLVGCHRTTVARIVRAAGTHARHLHDLNARDLQVTSIQADERYGFVGRKKESVWDATVIDPSSKFLIQGEVGERSATLAQSLLVHARERLTDPHGLVLFTDGFLSYQTLFPEVFGRPYQPARRGTRGRFPKTAYRIPRSSAHVRIIKEYAGKRVVKVRTEIAAGTRARVNEELQVLGYQKPNTSAVERQNATARRMNSHLARKSLAFARLRIHRVSLAHLVQGIYNWCRVQRGLRRQLDVPKGRQLYLQRTPAMTIGLTDHVWKVRDWLSQPQGVPCRA